MAEKKMQKKGNGRNNNRNSRNGDDDDFNPRARKMRKKVCALCADKNLTLDYKNPEQLKRFISEKGKILPRRASGACAKHQREITLTVKQSRHIALLPYSQG